MPVIDGSTYDFSVTSSEWSEVLEENDKRSPVVSYDPFKKNVIIFHRNINQ